MSTACPPGDLHLHPEHRRLEAPGRVRETTSANALFLTESQLHFPIEGTQAAAALDVGLLPRTWGA